MTASDSMLGGGGVGDRSGDAGRGVGSILSRPSLGDDGEEGEDEEEGQYEGRGSLSRGSGRWSVGSEVGERLQGIDSAVDNFDALFEVDENRVDHINFGESECRGSTR